MAHMTKEIYVRMRTIFRSAYAASLKDDVDEREAGLWVAMRKLKALGLQPPRPHPDARLPEEEMIGAMALHKFIADNSELWFNKAPELLRIERKLAVRKRK